MNYDENIGKNIKEVRRDKGLSQDALAKKCGFSNTTLSAYENRRKIPSLTTIAKIAKALEVSIERLYYGDENKSFIDSESDIGMKVVHSIYFLWSEGIISYYERLYGNEYYYMDEDRDDPDGIYLYIKKYAPQIKRLISLLNDFSKRENTFDDPQSHLKGVFSSVAKEINEITYL